MTLSLTVAGTLQFVFETVLMHALESICTKLCWSGGAPQQVLAPVAQADGLHTFHSHPKPLILLAGLTLSFSSLSPLRRTAALVLPAGLLLLPSLPAPSARWSKGSPSFYMSLRASP
jgi:hypothetical protein